MSSRAARRGTTTHRRKAIAMTRPKYDGLIEPWKVDLIVQRAKRNGFRPYEIPDAMQEAVLVILEFEYEPDNAEGASERTALTAVVDRRLRKMKRTDRRYQGAVSRLGLLETERQDHVDLQAMDVADAFGRLDPDEQAVCRGLAAGRSRGEIARRLGFGWGKVNRIAQRVQARFDELDVNLDTEGWR